MRFAFVCAVSMIRSPNFGGIFDLSRMTAELQELEAKMGQPDFWSDARAAAGVSRRKVKLERELEQWRDIEAKLGDVTALPFEDGSFDAVTVGFGIRNVPDLEAGLAELARVLRPGGRIACLEITRPEGLLKPFFRLWFDGVIPLAGKLLPGGRAYTYLPASVRRFPGPPDLAAAFGRAGFDGVGWKLMGGGIVALHVGTKR